MRLQAIGCNWNRFQTRACLRCGQVAWSNLTHQFDYQLQCAWEKRASAAKNMQKQRIDPACHHADYSKNCGTCMSQSWSPGIDWSPCPLSAPHPKYGQFKEHGLPRASGSSHNHVTVTQVEVLPALRLAAPIAIKLDAAGKPSSHGYTGVPSNSDYSRGPPLPLVIVAFLKRCPRWCNYSNYM